MSNELVESKENKTDELPEIYEEVKRLIADAKRKKFYFPNAEKTVKDVDILFFLNKKSHENISLISSKFLAASFALNYLKAINEIIEKKYKVPQLTLIDFIDQDKLEQTRQRIIELEDEPIFDWLKEECLEELKDAIDNVEVDNLERLVKFGQIINLSEKELSLMDTDKDIEIYDIVYRYLNRLDDFELRGAKHDLACEMGSIKKISKGGEVTEITLECKGDRKSRKQFEEFFIKTGKELISK
jgi:hypothetical protein